MLPGHCTAKCCSRGYLTMLATCSFISIMQFASQNSTSPRKLCKVTELHGASHTCRMVPKKIVKFKSIIINNILK